jgi:hypothetical protein
VWAAQPWAPGKASRRGPTADVPAGALALAAVLAAALTATPFEAMAAELTAAAAGVLARAATTSRRIAKTIPNPPNLKMTPVSSIHSFA